mmetsp:Transcript_11470/g.16137  ORF Transcript_11470/g.16137 Transcript_11470/m.16137 type:complete len:318 (+) Transcript_11470:147-1100(+)
MVEVKINKVKSAPPPVHTVAAVVLMCVLSYLCRPSLEHIDEVASIDTFTKTVFPYLNSSALGWIRILFACIVFATTIKNIRVGTISSPTYLPNSKLVQTTLNFTGPNGFKTQGYFTQWSWFLLGYSFLSSGLIALLASSGQENLITPWMLRSALISFEVAAPTAFLVSTIVTYALWPVALKARGPEGTKGFKTECGLMMHNANVFFVLCEVCLLGGLPVKLSHAAAGPLWGAIYVLFSWSMMNYWKPEHGPVALYFLLDTTLGLKSTIMVLALAMVLLIFYVAFSLLEDALVLLDGGFFMHLLGMALILRIVCRVRD